MLHLVHAHRLACKEQVYDNIATVTLGTTRWSPSELPLVHAIQRKYDALRHLLFLHMMRLDYGIAWDRYEARSGDRENGGKNEKKMHGCKGRVH